jgi:hypothetical protein
MINGDEKIGRGSWLNGGEHERGGEEMAVIFVGREPWG